MSFVLRGNADSTILHHIDMLTNFQMRYLTLCETSEAEHTWLTYVMEIRTSRSNRHGPLSSC